MIIYFGGHKGYRSDPERVMPEKANLMLSYHDSSKTPERRFLDIYKVRKDDSVLQRK